MKSDLRRVGECYNQYFTYMNNNAFYILAPTYLYQYYNMQVRVWDEWLNGWVSDFHSVEKDLLPTQFASSLTQKIADLIYGEGLLFESKTNEIYGESDKDVNKSLDFIGKLDGLIDIKGSVKDAILKSAGLGNSLLKLNVGAKNNIWVDALAGNRFFCNLNSHGEVEKVVSYVNVYTTGVKNKQGEQDSYGLMEERYYATDDDGNRILRKGEPVPMVVYKIYKMSQTANIFDPNPSGGSIPFEDLPRPVRRSFREEYTTLELNNPQELVGFRSLGVYLVKHTQYVNCMPNIKLGESCLARVINYLPFYDAINSEELIDLRVSRPKVLVPDFMQRGKDDNDPLSGYSDIMFCKIPNKGEKEQSPIVYAPLPREEHFIKMKEDIIKKMCANLGIAVSSLFSDIADSRGYVTDDEIASEYSNTALYVSNKRKIFINAVNQMIDDICYYYGLQESVKSTFTPAGSSNKNAITDINVKLKQSGLISDYQAIKQQHPEWVESQITEELERISENKTQDVSFKSNDDNANNTEKDEKKVDTSDEKGENKDNNTSK